MANSLSRKRDYRNSLMRNLATSLVLYEEIKTTQAKAKAVIPIVERLLQVAKKTNSTDTLFAKRRLLGYLFDENAVEKIFEVYVPRYKNIKSGFIKMYRIGPRVGDSAEIVMLKMVKGKEEEEKNAKEASASAANKEKTGQKAKPAAK